MNIAESAIFRHGNNNCDYIPGKLGKNIERMNVLLCNAKRKRMFIELTLFCRKWTKI
jgi:hypothetical protein